MEQNGWKRRRRRSWLHDSKWRARACVSVRFALGRSSPLSPSFTKLFSLFLPTFSVCFAKRKANDEAKDRREERKELCVCTSTHKGRDNVGWLVNSIFSWISVLSACRLQLPPLRDSRVDNMRRCPPGRDHLSQWRARGIWHLPERKEKGRM